MTTQLNSTERVSAKQQSQAVRLVCMGDTHERHGEVCVPNGDILIHVGDFTTMSQSLDAIEDFDDWLSELLHAHKIVCPETMSSFWNQTSLGVP